MVRDAKGQQKIGEERRKTVGEGGFEARDTIHPCPWRGLSLPKISSVHSASSARSGGDTVGEGAEGGVDL